ncbi:DoxX family protein [Mobiluncus mulieris ATCC 35239]|uniref:DoxX family protein n=1 Tax=Mobiluncus mulieris ATCC 35239 TaxID=871571 RepID=E0QTU1_9ACTO|nr:DoxX family protein [Mobiluncus mulieris]EFM45135.1 DoxX family protein [Mobiluncus mulieris ATCC 35239]EFN92864.1 DoxX family protein [Mobiluncus mulieris FB024-16]MCU9975170.1 DoxX family protein [Mobiluncus mulieris]MCU9993816.1 DoxX family protein [Mobiluncus mulieris]MCV0013881.1 DoxX family protein [Mobiluncus mulieris]
MKTLLRLVARPMLASVFFFDGLDALRSPDDHVERFKKIEPALEKLGFPPVLTSDARLLSRLAGFITVASALGLAAGKYPRTCAALLAAVNFPVTAVNNPMWMAKTPGQRRNYTRGLVVGASLAGGLGMAILDDDDQPSKRMRREILRAAKVELAK